VGVGAGGCGPGDAHGFVTVALGRVASDLPCVADVGGADGCSLCRVVDVFVAHPQKIAAAMLSKIPLSVKQTSDVARTSVPPFAAGRSRTHQAEPMMAGPVPGCRDRPGSRARRSTRSLRPPAPGTALILLHKTRLICDKVPRGHGTRSLD
jgi:hypothetical protein